MHPLRTDPRLLVCILLSAVLAGCPSASSAGEGEGEGDMDADGSVLFTRLVGLWAGPADSQTALGDFVWMSMDHRPTEAALFARGDLDSDNAIRWWLWRDSTGSVRFDNGGLFSGFQRHDSCILDSATDSVFRFCHVDEGCAHIDATFTFSSATALTLRVAVDGAPHVNWNADRVEPRDRLPDGFPLTAQDGAPQLPSLGVDATWSTPASAGAALWLVLTVSACTVTGGGCEVARSFRMAPEPGAQGASFVVHEVHPGAYFALLVVDNNGNFAAAPFPDSGDIVSVPNASVAVDAVEGGTLAIRATITR